MTNLERVSNTIDSAEQMARKMWLAGLGAYGKGFEEIRSQFDKLNSETGRLFEDLVSKGEQLEAETKDMFKEKTDVEKRVEEVRNSLGLDSNRTDTKIAELTQKVDALAEAVGKVS